MDYNHDRIKANAREFYSINKSNAIVVSLIYFGISLAAGAAGSIIPVVGPIAVSFFFMLNFVLGYLVWFRSAIYNENYEIGEVFNGFKNNNYKPFLITMLLKSVYIILWSLLFYIPGIIKAYSYGMTEYIIAENPNLAPSRAIELSMIMTDGYKGKLFYLDLSFLGWYLVGTLTFHILNVVYVLPYHTAAKAFAYEELRAAAIASGKIRETELTEYNSFSGNNSNY